MKSKIYLMGCFALILIFSLDSCKSKESAYKQAYAAAKAREINDSINNSQVEEANPVPKPVVNATSDVPQKEKVTVVDGSGIKQFSVVVGTFQNKTNAASLKDRMANDGYSSFLAQNGRGWYRVIVATFSDKASAVAEKERIKNKYPNFQDAWILDNQ